MRNFFHRVRLVGIALSCLLLVTSLRADSYSCIRVVHLTFPKFECTDLTLQEFIEYLRSKIAKCDTFSRPPIKPNVVLDEASLTRDQLSARISINDTDVRADELIHVVCKALGLGYRSDAYALVISSRARLGLPDPPTPRASVGPDGTRQRYLIFAAYKPTS